MWTSILKDFTNRHVWPDRECAHGSLLNHTKSWIDENSQEMKELKKIVMDSEWLKSMTFDAKFCHTGVLESYHNTRLKYAPKIIDLM